MSHHNSYYAGSAHGGGESFAADDIASPIAVHHASIASSAAMGYARPARYGGEGGASSVNTSSRSAMARQQEELGAIHAEIEALKERRRQLEMQRRLAAASNAPAASTAGRTSRPQSARPSARSSANTSAVDDYAAAAAYAQTRPSSSRGGPSSSSHRQPNTNATSALYEGGFARRDSDRDIAADYSRVSALPSRSAGAEARLSSQQRRGHSAGGRQQQQYADPYGASYPSALSPARSVSRRSQSLGHSVSLMPLSERPLDHTLFIPSERERRERLSTTRSAYRDMKEAMRASWQSDTALVGGYFLSQDNPRVGTFGRARRFASLQGQRDQYHLGTDMQLMQEGARSRSRPHFSVSNRGKSGCNVNSHWNDPKGGSAPGPGAYTPRYQKLAQPSILTKR